MKIGFDIISDLHLSSDDVFDWENKATSLYCLVAGNLSSDLRTIEDLLSILSEYYQGVFYIPGYLEYQGVEDIDKRTKDLIKISNKVKNLAVLHNHVVILDGVAITGCNGWSNANSQHISFRERAKLMHHEDLIYLKHSLDKLQRHLDVTKIIVVSNSVPTPRLYFGEEPENIDSELPLDIVLNSDTMRKVTHWVFGNHKKIVDTAINNINYVNNPCYDKNPYWAKRIEIDT